MLPLSSRRFGSPLGFSLPRVLSLGVPRANLCFRSVASSILSVLPCTRNADALKIHELLLRVNATVSSVVSFSLLTSSALRCYLSAALIRKHSVLKALARMLVSTLILWLFGLLIRLLRVFFLSKSLPGGSDPLFNVFFSSLQGASIRLSNGASLGLISLWLLGLSERCSICCIWLYLIVSLIASCFFFTAAPLHVTHQLCLLLSMFRWGFNIIPFGRAHEGTNVLCVSQ